MKIKVIQHFWLVVAAIGIVLMIVSVSMGAHYVNSVVRQHGGLDTATYLINLQEYIETFRDLGLGLLVIGGLGEISIIHKSQKIK